MVFKKKRSNDEAEPNAMLAQDRAEHESPEPASGDAGGASPVAVEAEMAPAPPAMPAMAASGNGGRNGGGGSANGGVAEKVLGLYGDPGSSTPAERERQAMAEFQAAIAPAMEMLVSAVPEASSPEDAIRTLEQKQSQVEVIPDPRGGAYVPGDSYDRDARVYYRLLRRNYERNPRPAKGSVSPFRTLPSAWRGP